MSPHTTLAFEEPEAEPVKKINPRRDKQSIVVLEKEGSIEMRGTPKEISGENIK